MNPAAAPAAELLEEILVTARKRAESATDVGMAIAPFSSADLARLHISAADEIASHVVNVDLNKFGNANPVVVIRGVGLQDFNTNNTPAAGIYIDEVYLPSNALADFATFDLERVELLKGPQGTLWGRNTIAGAVNFVTQRPSAEPELFTMLDVADQGAARFEMAGGGAVNDNLKGRLAAMYATRDDGMFTNRVSHRDIGDYGRWAARAQLESTLSARASARLTAYAGATEGDSYPFTHVGITGPDCPISNEPPGEGRRDESLCANAFTGYSDPDGDPRTGDWDVVPRTDNRGLGAVLRMDIEFDHSLFTSLTSYQDFDYRRGTDDDASPFPLLRIDYRSDIASITQELRWQSTASDHVRWIAGLQAAEDRHDEDRTADLSGLFPGLLGPINLRYAQVRTSAAAFGQLEWLIAPRGTLSLGGRYTHERLSFDGGTAPVPGTFDPEFLATVFPGLPATADLRLSLDDVSGRIGYELRWSENLLLWASAAKGFKSGGVFGGFGLTPEAFTPYDPERLYAYELGAKASLADGRLGIDLATFLYDYRDLQAQTLAVASTGAVPQLGNVGKVRITGAEATASLLLTRRLTATLAVGVLRSRLEDDAPSADALQRPLNLRGNELPHAAGLSAQASLMDDWPLPGNRFRLRTQIDVSFREPYYNDIQNQRHLRQEDHVTLVGARVVLSPNEGPWELSLWGRNLTDEDYISHSNSSGVGNNLLLYGEPRHYGAQVRYRWR